jgi:hypothetical protein
MMPRVDLALIKELYHLWRPVYPYLAGAIGDFCGGVDGMVLEVGPFCGAIFAMMEQGIGGRHGVATFPQGMGAFYSAEAEHLGIKEKVALCETTSALTAIKDDSVDCLVFRGALFFPGLFTIDFPALHRVLRAGGTAIVGGGFGAQTPDGVISAIGERSRDLNMEAGKAEVSREEIEQNIRSGRIPGPAQIITTGGLWIIMGKER